MIFQLVSATFDLCCSRDGHFRPLGAWFPSNPISSTTDAKENPMSPAKRYTRKQAKARKRHRLNAQERQVRQQRQAQRDVDALHQALQELGLPGDLVAEIEGRLRTQHKLLGNIFALMFPPLFGCRSAHELTRTRGWDKNWPSRIRGALPKRSWIKRLRKLGQDIVSDIWHRVESMSPATRSRWQLTPVIDDTVFRK
jgi:hypothetical protein